MSTALVKRWNGVDDPSVVASSTTRPFVRPLVRPFGGPFGRPSARRLAVTLAVAGLAAGALTVLEVGPGAAAASARSSSCPAPGGVAVPDAKEPSGAEVVVYGHGWGHGMGMSQYGAQGAAKLGCSYREILTAYYRGTKIVSKTQDAPVELSLDSSSTGATVLTEDRSVTWKGSRKRVQPKGETWTVKPSSSGGQAGTGLYDASGKRVMWTPAGDVLTAHHVRKTVRMRSYHGSSVITDQRLRQGVLRFSRGSSTLTVTERIGSDSTGTAVQRYLWGLGEVPVSWPTEALKAQVVAARTYMARTYSAGSKTYALGVTTADQVYRGASGEDNDARYGSRWQAAVASTEGRVVVDGRGDLITTMYSSSMGGHTEDRAYVYGSQAGYGYLTGIDDSRWDAASDNPYRSWTVGFSRTAFAKKLGFSSVTSVSVGDPGSASRDAGVVVVGKVGSSTTTKRFTGATFRYKLGLRSPGVSVDLGIGGSGAQALVGDWDGDGRTDVGWYRDPQVTLLTAKNKVITFRFGWAGATAVVGDWDGNGKDSIALFKDGTWKLRNGYTSTSPTYVRTFGQAGDVPVAGSWNTNRNDGIGVVRGTRWYLRPSPLSSALTRSFVWSGGPGTPVVGDWDGDGIDNPGSRSGRTWYLGDDAPRRGRGTVRAPGLQRRLGFARTSDITAAGAARAAGGDVPTIVRGTSFYWRPAIEASSPNRTTFGG